MGNNLYKYIFISMYYFLSSHRSSSNHAFSRVWTVTCRGTIASTRNGTEGTRAIHMERSSPRLIREIVGCDTRQTLRSIPFRYVITGSRWHVSVSNVTATVSRVVERSRRWLPYFSPRPFRQFQTRNSKLARRCSRTLGTMNLQSEFSF